MAGILTDHKRPYQHLHGHATASGRANARRGTGGRRCTLHDRRGSQVAAAEARTHGRRRVVGMRPCRRHSRVLPSRGSFPNLPRRDPPPCAACSDTADPDGRQSSGWSWSPESADAPCNVTLQRETVVRGRSCIRPENGRCARSTERSDPCTQEAEGETVVDGRPAKEHRRPELRDAGRLFGTPAAKTNEECVEASTTQMTCEGRQAGRRPRRVHCLCEVRRR